MWLHYVVYTGRDEAVMLARVHEFLAAFDTLDALNCIIATAREQYGYGIYYIDVPQAEWETHLAFGLFPAYDVVRHYDGRTKLPFVMEPMELEQD